jgi:hypothetical protein
MGRDALHAAGISRARSYFNANGPSPSPPWGEGVKKSMNEQKHHAPSRKGAELEKKMKQLFALNLCASASRREFVHFLTPSEKVDRNRRFLQPGRAGGPTFCLSWG